MCDGRCSSHAPPDRRINEIATPAAEILAFPILTRMGLALEPNAAVAITFGRCTSRQFPSSPPALKAHAYGRGMVSAGENAARRNRGDVGVAGTVRRSACGVVAASISVKQSQFGP